MEAVWVAITTRCRLNRSAAYPAMGDSMKYRNLARKADQAQHRRRPVSGKPATIGPPTASRSRSAKSAGRRRKAGNSGAGEPSECLEVDSPAAISISILSVAFRAIFRHDGKFSPLFDKSACSYESSITTTVSTAPPRPRSSAASSGAHFTRMPASHTPGMAHRASQIFEDSLFDGDENAIVDFKYSSNPKLTWWFDHHQSAFLTPGRCDAISRRSSSEKKMYDPSFKSCTNFISTMAAEEMGFRRAGSRRSGALGGHHRWRAVSGSEDGRGTGRAGDEADAGDREFEGFGYGAADHRLHAADAARRRSWSSPIFRSFSNRFTSGI